MILAMFFALAAWGGETPEAFFGYYRTKAYNGVENAYSTRFFAPSIESSPSVKLRREDGQPFRTFNFSFEVPVEEPGDVISLKYIFPEFPLDGAEALPKENGLAMSYRGKILERQKEEWHLCDATYDLSIDRLEMLRLKIELRKVAAAPCTSESHSILAEQVILPPGGGI